MDFLLCFVWKVLFHFIFLGAVPEPTTEMEEIPPIEQIWIFFNIRKCTNMQSRQSKNHL